MVTNSFDQSQGLAGGAVVNVRVKSGTNQMHGSVFEYNLNNAMTASSYFAPAGQPKAKYINNDYGGTLSAVPSRRTSCSTSSAMIPI